MGLGEAHEGEGIVRAVHGAGQHDVGGAAAQLFHRRMHRGQRGRAGRVNDEVRAAQVETVGDPTGEHVGQHAGKAVFGPFRKVRAHALHDAVPLLLIQVGHALEEVRQHRALYVANTHVVDASTTDDHGCAVPVEGPPVVAGVGQRPTRDLEREQLRRFDLRQRGRRDQVTQGVETKFVEEGPAHRVETVRGAPVLGVEQLRVPAVFGNVTDHVHALKDVGPVAAQVACTGKNAGHAHDRDGFRLSLALRHEVVPPLRLGEQLQEDAAARTDLIMNRGHRLRAVTQRRQRPDHVHPFAALRRLVHLDELAVRTGVEDLTLRLAASRDALGGHTQAAHVEQLEPQPHLVGRKAGGDEIPFPFRELIGEVGRDAARGVPYARFE